MKKILVPILLVLITFGCNPPESESKTEEKVQDNKQKVIKEVDISKFPPNGFQGDENTAKYNANRFYFEATKFVDMKTGRYRKADSALIYAAQSNFFSQSCAATTLMGQLYVQKGQIQKGLEYYNKAIELDPTQGEPFFNRGTAYYIMGNLPAACDSWRTALEMGIQNAGSALGMYCN